MLIYVERSQKYLNSFRRDNVLNNSNDEEEINHLCLMANEGVGHQDISDNDDDEYACTSDDEKEEEETEYDISNEVYDFLSNYSK